MYVFIQPNICNRRYFTEYTYIHHIHTDMLFGRLSPPRPGPVFQEVAPLLPWWARHGGQERCEPGASGREPEMQRTSGDDRIPA